MTFRPMQLFITDSNSAHLASLVRLLGNILAESQRQVDFRLRDGDAIGRRQMVDKPDNVDGDQDKEKQFDC